MSQITSLIIFCGLICITNGANVGESCQVALSGARGVCQLFNNCPEAVEDYIKRGIQPASCGSFVGRGQVICCPVKIIATTSTTPIPTRISQRKCREYEDAKYEKEWLPAIGFNEKPVLKKILHCATSNVPLIVGGEVANAGEFPHMALIGYQRHDDLIWGCAGSLISETFILTAAHCIATSRYEGIAKYVLLGEHDLKSDRNDRPLRVDIAETIPHPQFRRAKKYYDIGLVRMATQITFNKFMRPACLPETYSANKEHAIASGWGKTDYRGPTSDVLMKVVLELFSADECSATYINESRTTQLQHGILHDQQFCAGSHTEKKDTCQGDSGGPLQIYHPYIKCMYTVVGITSFAKQCGDLASPGVYTRTYGFLDWIENIVWPNQ